MKYLRRFNEGITEDEYNRILDKISDMGLSSITSDEKSKLDNFDGTFDKPKKNDDVIITTDHGGWTSNDINPKYLSDSEENKNSVYNDSTKKPKKNDEQLSKTLNSKLSSRWNNEDFHTLYEDNNILVLLDKFIIRLNRVYYVLFKNMEKGNDCRVLKLAYNLNKGDRVDNSHIIINDNNNNIIPFNKLDVKLVKNGLTFGDFNNAWFYIEEDFINK